MSRQDYAVFEDEHELLAAIRECRDLNLRVIDAWLPYPVHGIDELIGIRPTRLPWVTFAGGVTGVALALWFQFWSSATSWPLNVGGKPFDSLPAFIPITFEMLVLSAGLGTAFALFARSGMWPGRTRRKIDPRITDDRFVIAVSRHDAAVPDARVEEIWQRHGAIDSWSEVAQ
jgi:hypothetical protein